MVDVRKAPVCRGGSWNNNSRNCRVANRNRNNPDNRNNNLGFRVAQYFYITHAGIFRLRLPLRSVRF